MESRNGYDPSTAPLRPLVPPPAIPTTGSPIVPPRPWTPSVPPPPPPPPPGYVQFSVTPDRDAFWLLLPALLAVVVIGVAVAFASALPR